MCAGHQQSNPGRTCAAVVITDGAPTICELEAANLSSIVAATLADHGVRTYLAGVSGADFATLDAVARSSGIDCDPAEATYVCDGTGALLRDVLERIRDTAP